MNVLRTTRKSIFMTFNVCENEGYWQQQVLYKLQMFFDIRNSIFFILRKTTIFKYYYAFFNIRNPFMNIRKQNRESTEGYSKSIVRKSNDKFGKKIGLNK